MFMVEICFVNDEFNIYSCQLILVLKMLPFLLLLSHSHISPCICVGHLNQDLMILNQDLMIYFTRFTNTAWHHLLINRLTCILLSHYSVADISRFDLYSTWFLIKCLTFGTLENLFEGVSIYVVVFHSAICFLA